VKKVKGRKSNDIPRDKALSEWCRKFQSDTGRAPTRKEAGKKALELNNDPTFKGSKGWLDKFSKKFQIEFTPLKVFPPKVKKGKKIRKSPQSPKTSTTGLSRTQSEDSADGSPKLIKTEDFSYPSEETTTKNHDEVQEPDFIFYKEPQIIPFNEIGLITNNSTMYGETITNPQYATSPKFNRKNFPRFRYVRDEILNSEFNDKDEIDINSFLNFEKDKSISVPELNVFSSYV